MANKKFSGLTLGTVLALNDVLAILDKSDTTQSLEGSLKGFELATLISFVRTFIDSAIQDPPYTNINAMIVNQGNQTQGLIQFVADASDDPNVQSGYSYYEYLGTTNGDLTDYRLLSQSEAENLTLGYREVNIAEISQTVTATAGAREVNVEINASNEVIGFVFGQKLSAFLEGFKSKLSQHQFYIQLYQHGPSKTYIVPITNIAYTDASNLYNKVSVGGALASSQFAVNDQLEFVFDIRNNNVLELDNTTPFTPDGDYEPATKKYVDDSVLPQSERNQITSNTSAITSLTSSYSRRKAVIDIVDNTAAPPTEVAGDRYILDSTGASHANWDGAAALSIVEFDGTNWVATAPVEGYIAYVDAQDKDALYVDDGSPEWQLRSAGSANGLPTGGTTGQVLKKASNTDYDATWQDETPGGGDSKYTLANTYTLSATSFDGSQKGAFNLYRFEKETAQTVLIDPADYATGEVINIERGGNGTTEIIAPANVTHQGVRDVDNRFFVNDPNSLVAAKKIANGKMMIFGNLKRGYTGPVTTSQYSDLFANTTMDVSVTGTGFSSNMKTPVVTGNATLNSWTYNSNNSITLNLTHSGAVNDLITVTYDNGDVYVDTNAITVGTAPVTEVVMTTTSTSATWTPDVSTKTGAVLRWTVSGGASGVYDANKPTINLSGNTGTATIKVTSTDDLAGWTHLRINNKGLTSIDISAFSSLVEFWVFNNPTLTSVTGYRQHLGITYLHLGNTAVSAIDVTGMSNLVTLVCSNNPNLTSLILTGCSAITTINAGATGISSIDATPCAGLVTLDCFNSASLSNINISGLASLTTINAYNTAITLLDTSTNTALVNLKVQDSGSLTTLDIGNNTNVKIIQVHNTALTTTVINNIILDRFNNGTLTGTRQLYYYGGPVATATENTANDVLDAYNALGAAGWTINGNVPA